jgi:DNA-directed RNA polymerase subunit K/omega
MDPEQEDEFVSLDTENIVDETEQEETDDCIDIEEGIEETDKPIITDKSQRVSKNKMTRYEFVRIIGERIKQLTMGAKPMIRISTKSESFTYNEIAIEELKLNMIPFKIRRPLKDHYEIWSIDELDKTHLESYFIS